MAENKKYDCSNGSNHTSIEVGIGYPENHPIFLAKGEIEIIVYDMLKKKKSYFSKPN